MAEPAEKPEERLEAMVAAIAAKGDFPAAARVIQRLNEAVRREHCNALEVARVILDDPGLSAKVLRVVNSSFYRPRGEPVSTITRAVFLLGFEAIRDVTTRLLLIDELARASGSRAAIRTELHRSLLCGSVARALSALVGYPNPEEAYLLGLFANWGQLCFAAYYPDRYERALRSVHARASIEQALADEFGVPSGALATAMLARWNFPPSFAQYFREPHAALGERPVSAGERLFALVDVANDYALRVVDAADPDARTEMDAILRGAEAAFGRKLEDLHAAVDQAVEEAREHLPVLRGTNPRGAAPVRSVGYVHAVPSGVEDAGVGRDPDAAAPGSEAGTAATVAILAEVTRAILAHEDINGTLAMVLEGLARTGGFDVVFLVLLSARKDHLVGRLGLGEGVTQYLGALRVPLTPAGGVLAEAVLAREPRVVADAADAARTIGRDGAALGIASLVAHPLVVRGKAIGVLVAARGGARATAGAGDLALVQLFCNQAALALDRAVS